MQMKERLEIGALLWMVSLMVLLPKNGVSLGTPGEDRGWLADDPHWSATPG